MKKIIFCMTIIGLFVLVGCGSKNPNKESTNSNQTTETSYNPNESSENGTISKTESESSKPSESTTITKESSSSDDAYNDTLPWGPLH